MGRYARKKQHKGDKPMKKKTKTKRKTKDLDQIHADLIPEMSSKLLNQEVDFDKPGAAQHYCLHCAKYFINEDAMKTHFKSKPHKRRIKDLQIEPYTLEEAERAAGMGSYVQPNYVPISTQTLKTSMDEDGD
ncbi:hypothetical protein FSP39_003187 [Pinctada imbricata]|uniref:C2H2-type domain-containing protein n=1 Tax=Pinctada imbricata TaxID=66713 RepID=A0AA88Y7A8_PINIB|nr:hypothetical protein FSP39_003187 [Pinctada imbricata]